MLCVTFASPFVCSAFVLNGSLSDQCSKVTLEIH